MEANSKFEFVLSYPHSTHGDETAVITIRDFLSGLNVLEVELSPLEFMRFIHSHSTTKECWFHPSDTRNRIGKRYVWLDEKAPKEYNPKYLGYDENGNQKYDDRLLMMWAKGRIGKVPKDKQITNDGWNAWSHGDIVRKNISENFVWENFRLSHHNDGWHVLLQRWEDE